MWISSFFFISLIGYAIAQSPVCNPIECFYHIYTLFERSTSDNPCFKIIRLEDCISLCSPSSENMILEGILSMKLECSENPDDFISNYCENKHKFSLLSCMYESSTLESLNPFANESLLSCRRASVGEKCDLEVLPHCDPRTMTYKLTEAFFKPLHRKNCFYYSIQKTFDLEVKPPQLTSGTKDLKNLAECLDKNSLQIGNCIPQKWVMPEFLITAKFGNRLCKATEAFLLCMQDVIKNKCNKTLEDVFHNITQSLYNYTLPQCWLKTGSIKKNLDYVHNYSALSNVLSSEPLNVNETIALQSHNQNESVFENFTEASTTKPFNNEGVVVVHQKVFISLNYHDHVIVGACAIPCANLFILVICLLYVLVEFKILEF